MNTEVNNEEVLFIQFSTPEITVRVYQRKNPYIENKALRGKHLYSINVTFHDSERHDRWFELEAIHEEEHYEDTFIVAPRNRSPSMNREQQIPGKDNLTLFIAALAINIHKPPEEAWMNARAAIEVLIH